MPYSWDVVNNIISASIVGRDKYTLSQPTAYVDGCFGPPLNDINQPGPAIRELKKAAVEMAASESMASRFEKLMCGSYTDLVQPCGHSFN
jgi:hypothetical protein